MPGPVLGIQGFELSQPKVVNGRDKPGHDKKLIG
jgi:hypothetical protein